jgi:choline dehydrogenase-like flavoprotein
MAEPDVVVVGAGSAGCALAARLADAGRRVLVLEAGGPVPPDLRDAGTLGGAAPGAPTAWQVPAVLTDEVAVRVPRGRAIGGSSAINGGYFVRGTPADFAGWAAAGNDLWSYEKVLPAFLRLEDDRDFWDRPGHGTGGPMPVHRPAGAHPVVDAFAAAVDALGFPAEPDKNAGGPPGWGPIPMNVVAGRRVDVATAYLAPRPGVRVQGGVQVRRVVVERGRAVGVETDDGVVRAGEVVLSAGAVGSPHLLLLSGIGPAAVPLIEQRYLTEEADRRRLREGVRLAVELLRSPSVAPLVARRGGPPDDVLDDDAALDSWLRRSIGTAVHLAGSARMGPDADPGAVVDQHLRVRGVEGLRVVDTSVLPQVTSRGPAATAVMLGERAAELLLAEGACDGRSTSS